MSHPPPATIQTGSLETRYLRAGSGPPVLMLFSPGDELGASLFARLADHHRVVAPTIPDVPLSNWLRELIDGLGLVQPTVVADERFAGALLGFSLVDPGRVRGVVAICREDADPATSVGMLTAAHGLLVVAVDTAVDTETSARSVALEIARFVGDAS